jgi:hypothetical protein
MHLLGCGRRSAGGLATLWFATVALAATAPALLGERSLGPESMLDADPLYAQAPSPPHPAIYDRTRVYFDVPRDFAAAEGFRRGRLDLWNPRVALGVPLWSDGGALFLPVKFPFYVAPSRRTYDLAAALRLVVAGVGAYLLARQRGLGSMPAVAAGTLFELSGAILSTLPFGEEAPPCLLPWVVLGAHLIAHRRIPAAAAAAGLALGLTGLGGHVMFVAVVWLGFGVAIGAHALAHWRRPRTALTIVALGALAVLIGLALASPALLPVFEAQEVGRQYKTRWMYTAQHKWYRAQARSALPIAWFAPALLGDLRATLAIGFPKTFVAPTVGCLGLALAVAGLIRRRIDPGLLAVGLVGLGLTVGFPVLESVGRLPLVRYVYPMYAWSLVALPLTQAAGRGVAALDVRGEHWKVLIGVAATLAGAISLVLVHDVRPGSVFAFPLRRVFLDALAADGGWLRLALPLVLLPLLVGALVVGTRKSARYCIPLTTGLAALEILMLIVPTTWFRDSVVLGSPPSPAVRFLQQRLQGGQYRMLGDTVTPGGPATPSLFGLPDVRGVGPLPLERYVRYLQAISRDANSYVWQSPGTVLRHPLLDLAAARYIAQPVADGTEPEPVLQKDPAVRLIYHDARVAIYENTEALPRARIVYGATAVRDLTEALDRLVQSAAGHSHTTTALAGRIFVEPSNAGEVPPETPAAYPSGDFVRIADGDDPDEVELEAELSRPGWVLLADSFYPGWKATVDGVPTAIHPANGLFRSVFVSAGTHRITFRYEPSMFRAGLALAAVGLVMAGLLLRPGGARP